MSEEPGVWIVLQDTTPDNTVLGVFATSDEAYEYAEAVGSQFENGAITSFYKVGYKQFSDEFLAALPKPHTGD